MGNCTYKNAIVFIAGTVVAATSNYSFNANVTKCILYVGENLPPAHKAAVYGVSSYDTVV